MAGSSNDVVIAIDPQLYRFLVTGNINDFNTAVSGKQVEQFRYSIDNSNVLHIAASFGHIELVTFILEQWPQLFLEGNSKGDLALHSAIKAGNILIVNAFIDWLNHQDNSSERIKRAFEWRNDDGNTALHIALEIREEQLAKCLVGVHPQALYVMNNKNICPLYLYMAFKIEMNYDLVEYILQNLREFIEDTNRSLGEGKSILQALVYAMETEMLRNMLNYSPRLIDSIVDNEGKTALYYAVYMGDIEKARLLFESNPDSAFICSKDGAYPIHQAVLGGHTDVIKLLARSMFLKNIKGQNVIHVAIMTGKPYLISYLLDTMSKIDSLINMQDDDGNTPLHLAILTKHVRMVELLVKDVRVKVGVLNKEGLTANDLAKKLMTLDNQDINVFKRLNVILEIKSAGLKCAIDGDFLRPLYQRDINKFHQLLLETKVQLKDLRCAEDGSNILHIAARIDGITLKRVLDNYLPDPQQFDILMKQVNESGDLPIHACAQAGKYFPIYDLLEKSDILADDICARPNKNGNTPLHIAVLNKQEEIATYLYRKCRRAAYSSNKDNICPLYLSILYWPDSNIVLEMINDLDGYTIQNYLKGAKSIIHAAINMRIQVILERIVSKAEILLDSYDSKGRSPLSYAAHTGFAEGVIYILDKFPELEFKRDKDEDGSFPIHQATKGGQLETLILLHPENFLVNSKRQNILHIAAQTGKIDVADYLLESEKFSELLNKGDEDGNTPLHLAIKESNYYFVYRFTLSAYAHVNALNNQFLTARVMFHQRLQNPRDRNALSSMQVKIVEYMLRETEIGDSESDDEKEAEMEDANAIEKADDVASRMDSGNAILVVAALVMTATFAAIFTPPGGFDQQTGKSIFLNNKFFRWFTYGNISAFMCATISALFIMCDKILSYTIHKYLGCATWFIILALVSMFVAFASGSVLTVDQQPSKSTSRFIGIIFSILIVFCSPVAAVVLKTDIFYAYPLMTFVRRYNRKRWFSTLRHKESTQLDFTI